MCENHVIWRLLFFFPKILNVKNKAMVITACVYVCKTAPLSKTIDWHTTIRIKQNM